MPSEPAVPTQLVFVSQPTQGEGQEAFSPPVEVAAQDAAGNTVTDFSGDVSVALTDDPTGGDATLSGTTTVAASSGVATFSDLSIDLPAAGYALEATSGGLTAATSDPFAVRLTFRQVSAGRTHSCGVTAFDHAYCWGDNANGQLGDGATEGATTPVPVSGGLLLSGVSAGSFHSCGVTTAGEAYCWGSSATGQLGRGTGTDSSTPVAVAGDLSFTAVSAGRQHTCGLTATDDAFCWGWNSFGQVGDGTTTDRNMPVAVDVSGLSTRTFASVSAGGFHSCAVTTADEPFCWGSNGNGRLGDGTTTDSPAPVAVDVSGLSTETFAQVSAGTSHSCAVTTADEPFCWGSNLFGRLGDGTTNPSTTPVAVSTAEPFLLVMAARNHTCGLAAGDKLFCWGSNDVGQIGDGSTTDRSSPTAPSTTELFAQVSPGGDHSCGVTAEGDAFCWGGNAEGQLGDGTTTGRLEPVRVVQ